MSGFQEYLMLKEEIKNVHTEREIHNFLKKHTFLPMGMIKELQSRLDVINKKNKVNDIGVVHVIHIMNKIEDES